MFPTLLVHLDRRDNVGRFAAILLVSVASCGADEELVESGVQQFRIDVLPKLAGNARSAQYRTIVSNCKSVEFRTRWFAVYGATC
jgi:hypothetical protein